MRERGGREKEGEKECVREKEREKSREKEGEKECVRERERERERESRFVFMFVVKSM